jgi:kynurenine formamidase
MTVSLIEQLQAARVYDLEQPRFHGMPIYPTHKPGYFYALHRRHRDGYHPERFGPRSGASGTLVMMEHTGTHIDALCHQSCGLKLFGDTPVDAVETASGFSKLGIETVAPLLKRGVLLDVAGWRREVPLSAQYSITDQELAACAAAQGVEVRSGDVLLVRTGFGALWNDEAKYLQAAGISKSGTLWAADRGVAAVGADNMSWDVPGERDPDTGSTLFGHSYLLPRKGIYIIENLNLEELANDRHFVFAFVGIPLKFRGATGSPLRPLALVEKA